MIATAMVRHPQARAWIQRLVPSDAHGATPHRAASDALAQLLDVWEQPQTFAVSLDLQKGFDMLSPQLATLVPSRR